MQRCGGKSERMRTKLITEVRGYEWAVHGERGRPSEHSVFFLTWQLPVQIKFLKRRNPIFHIGCLQVTQFFPLYFHTAFMFYYLFNKAFPNGLIKNYNTLQNRTIHNLWDAAKAVLTEVHSDTGHPQKTRKISSNLAHYLKELEKAEAWFKQNLKSVYGRK